ncbi:sodium:proton exchanger [Candidatus Nomurabacteria bacterium CG_4_9_14_0_2_um_filter_32_10]|uniref:Sodium:proton exchanger n=3 Tax=Candidatus Nomuraibacteriota TaxID=1752729 RepID=A0A2H0CGY6_9BACT|nr:MAG: sodium:proton exchanger [Candidatus Nomurabacteria bacterium CG22_combo_CG10-13_8_21_14_all_32_8]PIZ86270.1 MAG: sodium:proton exchanger [Candidatus Nomurabacteria bacterium CG_4_10_14_0_2_um_filter_33_9]PJC49247.1 MAG: sodium:proton exchanger [Candidatus Nomurabacteria bacterium CG_4_9_14_0_2_um_filter_32_10]
MNIFTEIGLIILIATVVSVIMHILKQPLIVGYILSGIIIGPYFLNLFESSDYIEIFSKFGIAILLFIVGLNLKPNIIREVGKVSVIAGVGQVIFTSVIGFFIIKFLGFNLISAALGAIALTFSSTIIVLKLISDKDDLNKTYAKVSIGMLLVQDIIATIILLFMSISGSPFLLEGNLTQNILLLITKGFVFFVFLYLISKYILPRFLDFLAKSQELLFIFSIAWGTGLATLFHFLGFSLEIGALAAGVALASSPFSQEIGSRMKPLRDFFILLFFIMLGSQLILTDFSNIFYIATILSVFVLIGNPIIVFLIMNILGYRNRTSFLTGLTVAQISEFSLILIALGYSLGYLNKEFVSLITLVGIITIIGSTYFFMFSEEIYSKLRSFLNSNFGKKITINEEEENKENNMVIFGYDRVGYDFVNVAQKMNIKYLVIDFNPSVIRRLEKNKIPCCFGDADDIDFLEEIRISKSKIIISTIPDFETNLNLISYYRNHNKEGIIVVISHSIRDTQEFYKYGASFVIMPHYLGAIHASRMIENYGFDSKAFEKEKLKHIEEIEKRKKITEEEYKF